MDSSGAFLQLVCVLSLDVGAYVGQKIVASITGCPLATNNSGELLVGNHKSLQISLGK